MAFSIQIKMYCDLDPLDRWERFHKPLDQALQAAGFGEVTGGGTLMDLETEQVLYSDLTIRITDNLDRALHVIRTTLLHCGVPNGTQISVDGGPDFGLQIH